MIAEYHSIIISKSAVKTQQNFTALNSAFEQDKAILVQIYYSPLNTIEDLKEFQLLAKSAQVTTCQLIHAPITKPQAKYFFGSGKAEEIAQAVAQHQADIVLINHSLTPSQTRNLSQLCQCRIIDRTGLILDIFAQRARSYEGKLQVELAQLKYLSSHLIGRKTNLDQQKGAVGLRGPGETQLETDRRLIKIRINQLQNRLTKVDNQRQQNRQTRQKADIPTISLVGYTNAGKSTLFNLLSQANVYAADQLFATLDPTLRQINIQAIGKVIIADTVGFIRQLPHSLISAFKSTLQEVNQANLLLHIIDASDSRLQENIEAVNQVLSEINADQIPCLLVYNKIDQCENLVPKIEYDQQNRPIAVYISAQTQQGISLLLQAIQQRLNQEIIEFEIKLKAAQGKLRHQLYLLNAVKNEKINTQGEYILQIQINKTQWLKLAKKYSVLHQINIIDRAK